MLFNTVGSMQCFDHNIWSTENGINAHFIIGIIFVF